jgi:hypothetical protein
MTLTLAAGILAGCTSEPERSVEYYQEHRDEAEAKAKVCSEQADAITAADGNCNRARKALFVVQDTGPQKWHSVVE